MNPLGTEIISTFSGPVLKQFSNNILVHSDPHNDPLTMIHQFRWVLQNWVHSRNHQIGIFIKGDLSKLCSILRKLYSTLMEHAVNHVTLICGAPPGHVTTGLIFPTWCHHVFTSCCPLSALRGVSTIRARSRNEKIKN